MSVNSEPTSITMDGMQYCNWSRKIFEEMRAGNVTAVHVTVAYHENFRQTVERLVEWNRHFSDHADLILRGRDAADIERARASQRTAIFFGVQNPSPMEDNLGLVEVLHDLGIRFMQLSYNNQSLLCTGWGEAEDTGVTKMGREVIAEMNRIGMVIDMSHSGERSTLEAIELSKRPIAVSHAAPSVWRSTNRNKSDRVLKALAASGGIIGLSLYPHHIQGGSECPLENFTDMVKRLADMIGVEHIGIGSDLCQDQPPSVLAWMRTGRWTFAKDDGGGAVGFPPQPVWFRNNSDFGLIRRGLVAAGFSDADAANIMGNNWQRFLRDAFLPADRVPAPAAKSRAGGSR